MALAFSKKSSKNVGNPKKKPTVSQKSQKNPDLVPTGTGTPRKKRK